MKHSKAKTVWFIVGFLLVVTLVMAACQSPSSTPKATETGATNPLADKNGPLPVQMPKFFTISGTSAPNSQLTYVINPIVANFQKAFPDMVIRHLPGGALPNVNRVSKKEADLGVSNTVVTAQAYAPDPSQFKERQELRALGYMFINNASSYLVTLPGSGISSLADLKGKKLGTLDRSSSLTTSHLPLALAAHQMSYQTIQASGGSIYYASSDWGPDLFDKLYTHQVDAIALTTMRKDAYVTSQDVSKDLNFVGLTPEEVKYATSVSPGLVEGFIPAGTYRGSKNQAIRVFQIPFAVFVNKDMPDDVSYNLVWALYRDDGKAINEAHPDMAGFDFLKEQVVPEVQVVPLHPGAQKYWEKVRSLKFPPLVNYPATWKK